MFWTILGIVVPACLMVYFGALLVKNVMKLFGK